MRNYRGELAECTTANLFVVKNGVALTPPLDAGLLAGIAGVAICFFWLFTAIFAPVIAPFDPLTQVPVMKDALPGAIDATSGQPYLFGGDKLARDVFSRMVFGSQIVLIIAPAATAFALMVGITLGLPAGYYGGRVDTILSFLANLVLAFPVILLFYLLVTPGIMDTPIPYGLAGLFFLFPIIFFSVLFYTRFKNRPQLLAPIRWASSPSSRTSSTSSWQWSLHRAPACSVSCAASPWTSRRATMWRLPRRAGRLPGTSCFGKSCPMHAVR